MEQLLVSLGGLVNFFIYFSVSIVILIVFKFIYAWVTPYDEWGLIKQNNQAAALAFVGAIVGFSLALAGAASNSISLIDFVLWSVVALVAQLLAFFIARLFMPKMPTRIEQGELAAGIVVAGLAIAIGLLNAACMTY